MHNKYKTHCKNGHIFDKENTAYMKSGSRRCQICHKQNERNRYQTIVGLREKMIKSASLYQKSNPDIHHAANLKYYLKKSLLKHKLTLDQYHSMNESQNFCCFICGKEKVLCIDHDHNSGKVRKLLCHNCNLGLGNFMESSEIIKNALDYVERYSCQ